MIIRFVFGLMTMASFNTPWESLPHERQLRTYHDKSWTRPSITNSTSAHHCDARLPQDHARVTPNHSGSIRSPHPVQESRRAYKAASIKWVI